MLFMLLVSLVVSSQGLRIASSIHPPLKTRTNVGAALSSLPCKEIRTQSVCVANSTCVWASSVPSGQRCVLRPPRGSVQVISVPPNRDNRGASRLGVSYKSQVQQYYRIGGNGGTEYLYDQINQGSPVKKIEAWAGGSQLRGVKMHFTNGYTAMLGEAGDSYKGSITIDIPGGEYVTALSIWGNGAGSRCGAFRIKTNKGQTFFPQMTSWGLKTEYKMEVGSGIILGMWGKSGSDVDSLSISLLRKVVGTNMVGVTYDMKGSNLDPPQKKSALDVTLANPTHTDSDKGYQKVTKTHTTGGEWSVTAGVKFGQSYEVDGGIPFVAEGKATTSWEISVSSTYKSTWSDSTGYETSIPLFAPALEKTRVTVGYWMGQLSNLPFTANMVYYLDNQARFVTKVSGMYKCVSSTKFVENTALVARWDDGAHVWVPV